MLRYRYGQKLPELKILKNRRGCAITIGNFDGVHLGHQFILKENLRLAKAGKLNSLAILFDPHPSEIVGKAGLLPLLSDVDERTQLLTQWGVDTVLCLEFTQELSRLRARAFCQELLRDWLKIQVLCVGENFHLGYRREGNPQLLTALGNELGFTTQFCAPVLFENQRISSSYIRQLLQEGAVDVAQVLLGRPYALTGSVERGQGRGEKLGIPTANISVQARRLVPKNGVYACWAHVKGRRYRAVTNIGQRPTFDAPGHRTIEAHLSAFKASIYGQPLTLDFVAFLREERRFASPQELKTAIDADIEKAATIL